jgi:hypothetical protein
VIPTYILAADLGQAADYTAVIGLRRAEGRTLECLGIERLPLGTPYPRQAEHLADLLCTPPFVDRSALAVDATGVGAAVVDLLRPKVRPAPFYAVTITGGDTPRRDGHRWSIPKRDLIGAAVVAVQERRVKIPSVHPLAATLVEELLAYRVTISAAGHDTYGNDWRQADHDDLVLAPRHRHLRGRRHLPASPQAPLRTSS